MAESFTWIFSPYRLHTLNSRKWNSVFVITNALFTMNQFNFGQRRIGKGENKEISNLLTESKRAGKESIMNCQFICSSTKRV